MNDTLSHKFVRGQIYNVGEDTENSVVGAEIWANRPAVIVSNDVNNAHSNVVEMVFLSTSQNKKAKRLPTHIIIQSDNQQAVAMCEQIVSVDKRRLGNLIGKITKDEELALDRALLISLGISNTVHPTGLFKKWENYITKYGISYDSQDCNQTLQKERDSYRMLYEAKCKQLQELQTMINQIA